MAFLDNSGDIIVDAVLTDVGRQMLAQGRFEVSQFALGDDEIDYALFDTSNTSGSAYYDINILNTPVFEPSTASRAGLKTKLLSYPNPNLLHLPVLKLNQSANITTGLATLDSGTGAINILATDAMIALMTQNIVGSTTSLIDGRRTITTTQQSPLGGSLSSGPSRASGKRFIRVSQGFDSANVQIPLGGLEETSFSVYVNRLFLRLLDKNSVFSNRPTIVASPFQRSQATDVYRLSSNKSFAVNNSNNPVFMVSDSYFGETESFINGTGTPTLASSLATNTTNQVGKEVQFSVDLADFTANNPSYYFTTYGQAYTGNLSGASIVGGDNVSVISTSIRIMGNTFGFAVDIPVKLFYK